MDKTKAVSIVADVISDIIGNETQITPDKQLIGTDALVDSMKLVEICLALEDIADDMDFEFDWTSAAAMSKSKSMFRTVESLAEEFAIQSKANA